MKHLSLADSIAIRVAATFSTWRFIGFQLLLISIWYLWNPFRDHGHGSLDLAISIWTLILDCIILIGNQQQSKELLKNTEATIKLINKSADLLDEEKAVHQKIMDSQDKILEEVTK